MAQQRKIFLNGDGKNIEGAIKRGIPLDIATSIFDEMEKFAEYAFNKSHAAAYAVLAYQTAYLKKYHIVEFIAAVLNNRIANIDDITKYVTYCEQKNIKILPPDINKSKAYFSVEDGNLRFSLLAIKNVGEASINGIISEREKNGSFKSLSDLFERIDLTAVNKRMLESMIKAGTFDCFNEIRSRLIAGYEKIFELAAFDKKQKMSGQVSFFDEIKSMETKDIYPDIKEYKAKDKFAMEKEVCGVYISGHPLDEHREKYKEFSFNTSMLNDYDTDEEGNRVYNSVINETPVTLGGILTQVKKIITKKGTEMAACRLEDLYGSIEIILFTRAYEKLKSKLTEDSLVTVSGMLSIREGDNPKILADNIVSWVNEPEKITAGTLYLKFAENLYDEICEILANYEGDYEVKAKIDGKAIELQYKVRKCPALNHELLTVLQPEDIVFKEK